MPPESSERHRPTTEPSGDSSLSGVVVDQYRTIRLIGSGSMSEVYLARDTQLGRKVALKFIRLDQLGGPAYLKRILHEARTTARFNHPHIVTLYGVGEYTGYVYLALEFLEGRTLRRLLEKNPPGQRRALRIALAITEAIAEAHRHGVQHGDLKPENIIIPDDGQLRVLDFGLAAQIDAVSAAPDDVTLITLEHESDKGPLSQVYRTRGKGLRGTPAYMAPEQWRRETPTPAADVWALGTILHELFAGQAPFPDAGFYRLCRKALAPEPVLSVRQVNAELSAPLADLIDRCLLKDLTERPIAREGVATLRKLLGREEVERDGDQSPTDGPIRIAISDVQVSAHRPAREGGALPPSQAAAASVEHRTRYFSRSVRQVLALAGLISFIVGAGIVALVFALQRGDSATERAARGTSATAAATGPDAASLEVQADSGLARRTPPRRPPRTPAGSGKRTSAGKSGMTTRRTTSVLTQKEKNQLQRARRGAIVYLKMRSYPASFAYAKAAYKIRPSPDMAEIAARAACLGGYPHRARWAYRRLRGQQKRKIAELCRVEGMDLQ